MGQLPPCAERTLLPLGNPAERMLGLFLMPYITHIHVDRCRNIRDLDIDLSMPRAEVIAASHASSEHSQPTFQHLILTGPNGSGKSGVLEMIAREVEESVLPAKQLQLTLFELDESGLRWNCDPKSLPKAYSRGELLALYLRARRGIRAGEIRGPSKPKKRRPADFGPAHEVGSTLHQFLVNKHVEMTYATAAGDTVTANRIAAWFERFESHLQRLMEDEGLSMTYDSKAYFFSFHRSDGYSFDLNTLADGHAAVLALLAELLIRVDALQSTRGDFTFEPEGVIIVDEVETHLHLSLQEQILPFLTDVFPRFQFIVATHSPAVIASIPNAVVYDLKKRAQTLSDHFRGVRYGKLMTEHFGIASEIDLDSTEKLVRLRELASGSTRTAEEQHEFDSLAEELSARSRTLAVEVWMIRERLGEPLDVAMGEKR